MSMSQLDIDHFGAMIARTAIYTRPEGTPLLNPLSSAGGEALAPPLPAAEQRSDAPEPPFTDWARCALLWVLWHHQGASSAVGQPLRFALGMGQHDRLTPVQVADARAYDTMMSARQRPRAPADAASEK